MYRDPTTNELVPTLDDINGYLATLPAATREQSAVKMGCSVSKIARIKTYLCHHPELGFIVSASDGGPPDFTKQERHVVVAIQEPSLSGLYTLVHTMCMYLDFTINQMEEMLKYASPAAKGWLPFLLAGAKGLRYTAWTVEGELKKRA